MHKFKYEKKIKTIHIRNPHTEYIDMTSNAATVS